MRKNINFVAFLKYALILSGTLFVLSIVSIVVKGFNWGVDFAGGSAVYFKFSEKVEPQEIRNALSDLPVSFYLQEIQPPVGAPQNESHFVLKTPIKNEKLLKLLISRLRASFPKIEILKIDMVGPAVGKKLRIQGLKAAILALLVILIYISVRFEFDYGIGAVLALFHDVVITLGLFSFLQRSFDLNVLAAILTLIGYSLNDTIVVYDRIRENIRLYRGNKRYTMADLINMSINQTLSRTINTSLTTLLAVGALFFLGGPVIHDFSLVMFFGVIVGTYSSIFIASPVLLLIHKENLRRSTFK